MVREPSSRMTTAVSASRTVVKASPAPKVLGMRVRLFSRFLIAAVLSIAAATPARAAEEDGPAYASQFDSLAAAMLQFYAAKSGVGLQGLLQSNSPQVANILGSPVLATQIGPVATTQDLQARLKLSGASFDFSSMGNVDDLFAEVNAKAGTIDGKVTLFGAEYATKLGQMRMPALALPSVNTAGLPLAGSQIPAEGLAFGLFMNASLTNLVANHPDVFAQVQTSGLGTPAALAAWKASMLQAGTTTGSNLSRLPMPCIAEMLNGMASGAASGSSSACGSCAIAGSYLHSQAAKLLDPSANTALPGSSTSDPSQTQPWLQDALQQANPGLSAQLNQVFAPNASIASCASASAATSSTLTATLPGLFSNLNPTAGSSGATTAPRPTLPTLPSGFGSGTLPTFPGGFGSLTPKR